MIHFELWSLEKGGPIELFPVPENAKHKKIPDQTGPDRTNEYRLLIFDTEEGTKNNKKETNAVSVGCAQQITFSRIIIYRSLD